MDTKPWRMTSNLPTSTSELLKNLRLADNGKWIRIAEKIEILWGTKECHHYLKSLMFNDRPTPRQGFPAAISDFIFLIAEEHKQFYEPPGDIWSESLLR